MLKIVHVLAGVIALLLSFVPSLRPEAAPYFQQPDAVYLVLFGLLNLLLAPLLPIWHIGARNRLQGLVSALLLVALVLQVLIVFAPLILLEQLPAIGEQSTVSFAGQPAVLFSLLIAVAAIILHLAINLQLPTKTASVPGDMSNRETGTVKWFNTSKGFGFISRDMGEDIFVHFRAIRGEGHRVLVEGQRVEFSVMQRDKGLQAEDVITAAPLRR